MKKNLLYILFIVALALSACAPAATPTPTAAPTAAPKLITVDSPWGRTSGGENGAVYMILRNTTAKADKLTKVTSDACKMAELHETVMQAGGVMGMQPVKGGFIEVPANGSVELKPGGFHIMCMMKTADFKVGNDVHFVLTFANAGEITIHADIKDQ